jgi:hypothetical protein
MSVKKHFRQRRVFILINWGKCSGHSTKFELTLLFLQGTFGYQEVQVLQLCQKVHDQNQVKGASNDTHGHKISLLCSRMPIDCVKKG